MGETSPKSLKKVVRSAKSVQSCRDERHWVRRCWIETEGDSQKTQSEEKIEMEVVGVCECRVAYM